MESTSGNSLLRLTDASVTNSKTDTSGGFIYAKGTSVKLLMDFAAKLTAIGAKNVGGVALMDGSTNSEIELIDMSSISQGESTQDSGGIAFFKGPNNYLKIKNGAVVAQCSSKKDGGCFYFDGSGINEVYMMGGAMGDA